MAMAYKDLTVLDLEERFGVTNRKQSLFSDSIMPVEPSDRLKKQLRESSTIPMRTEKARSELVVIPILLELRRRNDNFFTIYSGEQLIVDKNSGLNSECDFILSQDTGSYTVSTPIITLVEAKKQDLDLGIDQCAAQMYGALQFNAKRRTPVTRIYGCVTTADMWQFMMLEDQLLTIDNKIYYFNKLEEVLGIFQHIIDYFKKVLPEARPVSV